MKHEWKKHEKILYGIKTFPIFTEIAPQNFIMIKGRGNPNEADFSNKVSALYSLAYAVKTGYKAAALKSTALPEIHDFAVYPLEGIWRQKDSDIPLSANKPIKENLEYTIMIRQPDFITTEMIQSALEKVRIKKPNPLYEEIFFDTICDGKCIEMLHIGSYDNEPVSFAQMDEFARENGLYRVSDSHREIYLNDANRTKPEQRKTILRYQVDA